MGKAGHTHYAVLIAASVLVCSAASAQTQNTQCRWVGSTWSCNTAPAPSPPAPIQGPNGGTMIEAYRAGRQDRPRVEPTMPQEPPGVGLSAKMENGNGMLALCRSKNTTDGLTCASYMSGLIDGQISLQPLPYCLPEGATVGQMIDVVVAFIESKPTLRHHSTATLTLFALGSAFPCQPK